MPKWPTGCESVSTVMLLNYYGINISVDEFITYLPCSPLIKSDGQWYGYSPNNNFIGSPYDSDSFGCYSNVIASTINNIVKDKQLSIYSVDISSLTTNEIISRYIMNGHPVLYWSTIDLKPSFYGPSWKLLDYNNKDFTWISNEHCLVLVGADENGLWFNDPWNNNGIVLHPKPLVEQRHKEMLSMALAIAPK